MASVFPECFRSIGFDDLSDLRAKGYSPLRLSMFDRVLTDEEAAREPLTGYAEAVAAGLLMTFKQQERQFLEVYRDLFGSGVVMGGGGLVAVLAPEWGPQLQMAVMKSQRGREPMDIYVPRLSLRVVSGLSRADWLLFEDSGQIPTVRATCERAGLHVLAP